jgi:hypothetical protein
MFARVARAVQVNAANQAKPQQRLAENAPAAQAGGHGPRLTRSGSVPL